MSDRMFFKSRDDEEDLAFTQNRLVLFTETPDDAGNAGIYLQTQRGEEYDLSWVVLNKAEAMELATQIAYHAQFLED